MRRFQPLTRTVGSAPSQLSSLLGDRRPGGKVNFGQNTKPPKTQFQIGQMFHYDGEIWKIIYMYRMAREPGVWYHELESMGNPSNQEMFLALGAGVTTPRVVVQPFMHSSDVDAYFRDIYRNGDGTTKTTQQLLHLKKV